MLLEELIKLLTSVPPLQLNDAAYRELVKRTNYLAPQITVLTFNELLRRDPTDVFSATELKQIRHYLSIWPELIRELNYLHTMINIAWFDIHKSPIDGDSILSLFCELLPKSRLQITHLSDHLKLSIDIHKNGQSAYYFTSLYIALEQVTIDLNQNEETLLDPKHDAKCIAFIESFNHPTYFSLLNSLITLKVVCEFRTISIEAALSRILSTYQQPDIFNSCRDDIRAERNAAVRKLATELESELFSNDVKLIACVEKHIIYQDIQTALTDRRILSILKDADNLHLFHPNKGFTALALKRLEIEVTDKLRYFLNLPPQKLKFILTLFKVTTSKIPLSEFIEGMSERLQFLLEEVDADVVPVFETPQPAQLAELLRLSL